ncbi:hypothetical protein EI42_04247 [Thermosporothrix hazakensis]|jgi:hypothetical protein|uniref:Uncharacterized protein n=2 Tax=Thermosporothrix TaxID=768650 RepID=A0A326U3Q8_THEHA|nr:hypothetical protein [Thermosporothrix hazakensis]PZW25403.1 hypothetical protein EI42_04247 [Thermosporothrix hazakensis]BBH90737.1 hypothetical protein KTC_54880 [Thermosporothrix sp. COM3]GCE48787.1 hypothetical protein KTH_36560 [Thermosporothrix hazakensis]
MTNNLLSRITGIILALGALLALIAYVLHLFSVSAGTTTAYLLFIGLALILLGLPGLYGYHNEHGGWLGYIGYLVTFVGLLFSTSTASVAVFNNQGSASELFLTITGILWFVGLVLFGWGIWQAGALRYARWIGLAFILAAILVVLSLFPLGTAAPVLGDIGRVVFALAVGASSYTLLQRGPAAVTAVTA